jgi:competence ComEA-like helix-hairpin-helix protein
MTRKTIVWLAAFVAIIVFISLSGQAMAQANKKLVGKTVNINKATAEEMVKNVPLMTPDLAKKIVKYRQDNGDFQVLDELLQVQGMTRDLLKRIKPFLLLEGLGGSQCTC